MPMKSKMFVPTAEYRLVQEDSILPRGVDVRIDMQTGEKWARLAQKQSAANNVVYVKESETLNSEASKDSAHIKKPPAYSNTSSKWKGHFQSVSGNIEQALADLEFEISREDALELLEDEASALAVGAGIIHSAKFVHLRTLLLNDPRAVTLLSVCLQNNPPAVFKAVELGILEHELSTLLQTVDDSQLLKRLIQLLNSFLIHGDNSEPEAEIVEQFKKRNVLKKLLEAISRTTFTPTERQLVILLRIASAVHQDLPDFATHPDYQNALAKHCESYPKCKLCQ